MQHSSLASPPGRCLANTQLLGLLVEGVEDSLVNDHLRQCLDCLSRQEKLLDCAAAHTCLDFSPNEWEAFRRFRIQRLPVHQVSLELGMPWREVWETSVRITAALRATVESQR